MFLSLDAQEDLKNLLNTYIHESELSKITKQEEAGVIDIYTRHDLEAMQAKTFEDVLRVIPGFHLTRTVNNLTSLNKPSFASSQLTSIRLYINDHDMSSSSFGSSFLIWGEVPIEYIDHIEVYKGAASIEFGNETSTVIIKMYTKTPQREEGSKLRLYTDNYGSKNVDFYTASSVDKFSYFTYANYNYIEREEYENKGYKITSDHSGHNLYANLQYNKWILELGSYYKESDSFLGKGIELTPNGGDLEAYQHYIHITKKFDNNLKFQLSYDIALYDRDYIDPNGISISNAPIINNYNIQFKDTIFSVVLEKKKRYNNHSFLLGGLYKKKSFVEDGEFINTLESYDHSNSFKNRLNLFSVYSEYSYDYDSSTRLLASVKEDFLHYEKSVVSCSELSAKIGLIKYIDNLKIKAFVTKTYSAAAFYQLYNPDNIPYKANPDLENMDIIISTLSTTYKKKQHSVKFLVAKNRVESAILYNPKVSTGYTNSLKTFYYIYYELFYEYMFDMNNKFSSTLLYAKNSQGIVDSPQKIAMFKLFTKYKKFDIYNELIYKSAYEHFDVSVDQSYNYTASIKYHYTKDFSLGVRGENIFNSGFKQVYKGLEDPIAVTDQKVWFNMEYLF
jgi:iron complex outermembrane receptor protein